MYFEYNTQCPEEEYNTQCPEEEYNTQCLMA